VLCKRGCRWRSACKIDRVCLSVCLSVSCLSHAYVSTYICVYVCLCMCVCLRVCACKSNCVYGFMLCGFMYVYLRAYINVWVMHAQYMSMMAQTFRLSNMHAYIRACNLPVYGLLKIRVHVCKYAYKLVKQNTLFGSFDEYMREHAGIVCIRKRFGGCDTFMTDTGAHTGHDDVGDGRLCTCREACMRCSQIKRGISSSYSQVCACGDFN
jgi:hypothetical protein